MTTIVYKEAVAPKRAWRAAIVLFREIVSWSATLCPPPQRLERPSRQKQSKENHGNVVNQIFRVDHAAGEAVHMADDREIVQNLNHRRISERSGPVQNP